MQSQSKQTKSKESHIDFLNKNLRFFNHFLLQCAQKFKARQFYQGNFMSKKVQVEKTIDLYKIPLSALIVALFGIIAFAFVNAEKLPIFKLCALIDGIILVATAIGVIVWQCVKNLKKLEAL